VDSSLDSKYPVGFFDLEPGGRMPAEDQQTIVIGFPRDIARRTYKGALVVFMFQPQHYRDQAAQIAGIGMPHARRSDAG
jgi:hypothetical protein